MNRITKETRFESYIIMKRKWSAFSVLYIKSGKVEYIDED